MKRITFIITLFFIFLISCDNNAEIETNFSEPMADFEFKTQDEDLLNSNDLKGDWWIANFMYTKCEAVCPITTDRMADIQKTMAESNLTPQIVSFSIDPSNDTPSILKEYANQYDADFESWSFLTGYDFETIKKLSEQTFKSSLAQGAVGQMSHGVNFYLINPDGVIIKEYNGMNTDDLDILIDDLETVL